MAVSVRAHVVSFDLAAGQKLLHLSDEFEIVGERGQGLVRVRLSARRISHRHSDRETAASGRWNVGDGSCVPVHESFDSAGTRCLQNRLWRFCAGERLLPLRLSLCWLLWAGCGYVRHVSWGGADLRD